jgi:hypothetical protein
MESLGKFSKFAEVWRFELKNFARWIRKVLPIGKKLNRSISRFCEWNFWNFSISFDRRFDLLGAPRWRGRALPRMARLSRRRLNPFGRRSLARVLNKFGQPSPTLHKVRTVLAAVKDVPFGRPKRPSLTFAVRRAPRRCRAGTEERLRPNKRTDPRNGLGKTMAGK